MPRTLDILFRSLLALGLCSLVGCGEEEEASEPASSTGDEAASLSEEERQILRAVIHPGCLDACVEDQAICTEYCDCTLRAVETTPELSAIGLNGLDDPEQVVELLQATMNQCGEVIYAHFFVRGCTDACVGEGAHSEAIGLSRCQCVYDTLRERHQGADAEGLAHLFEQYSQDELSPEAERELHEVGARCYLSSAESSARRTARSNSSALKGF